MLPLWFNAALAVVDGSVRGRQMEQTQYKWYWLDRATEVMFLASAMADPLAKGQLLGIVQRYIALAERARSREPRGAEILSPAREAS